MNVLSLQEQQQVIGALAEGNSIRSVERMTGIHRDTIMRLAMRTGEHCAALSKRTIRNLRSTRIQMDEVWCFVGKKQANLTDEERADNVKGDAWTFVALDSDTKLVIAYYVGKRDFYNCIDTVAAVRNALDPHGPRPTIATDAFPAYAASIHSVFASTVDHGQLVKHYSHGDEDKHDRQRRYSPAPLRFIERVKVLGDPAYENISTSYVERQNLTLRMHVRRYTRLTNAFSKKLDNLRAAVSLHFAYYNFVKVHSTLGMTPAMAAGLIARPLGLAELLPNHSGV